MNLIKNYEDSIAQETARVKRSFWASDHDQNKFDLFHAFMGTPHTNVKTLSDLKRFTVQKGVELALVTAFKHLEMETDEIKSYGFTKSEDGQWHMEMERLGIGEPIKITGKPDFLMKGGIPVEIKTFYHDYQKRDLDKGIPHLNYLKQLATYMDFMSAKKGILFIHQIVTNPSAEVGVYEFELINVKGRVYKCGDIEFNLDNDYRRFADIFNDYVKTKTEPKSDFVYKYPLAEIKWREITKSKISKARNNTAVLGDWQVVYSPYKDLIVEREGSILGYTSQELEQILESTKGYTTWK